MDRWIRKQVKLNSDIRLSVKHPLREGDSLSVSYKNEPEKIAENIANARQMLRLILRKKDIPLHRKAYRLAVLRDPNTSLEEREGRRRSDASLLVQLMQPTLWNSFAAFGEKADAEGLQKLLNEKDFVHHHSQLRSILSRIEATKSK